jgi:hypothetical protein
MAQDSYNSTPGFLQNGAGLHFGNDVVILAAMTGVPVDGTSGTGVGVAGKGSQICNYATGEWYVNYGTKASPSWAPHALIS